MDIELGKKEIEKSARDCTSIGMVAALGLAGVGSLVYFWALRRRRLSYWMRLKRLGMATGNGAKQIGSSVATRVAEIPKRLFT